MLNQEAPADPVMLYRAATDLKSGDMTGTTMAGFTAAVP
jgi:hypothetical protein